MCHGTEPAPRPSYSTTLPALPESVMETSTTVQHQGHYHPPSGIVLFLFHRNVIADQQMTQICYSLYFNTSMTPKAKGPVGFGQHLWPLSVAARGETPSAWRLEGCHFTSTGSRAQSESVNVLGAINSTAGRMLPLLIMLYIWAWSWQEAVCAALCMFMFWGLLFVWLESSLFFPAPLCLCFHFVLRITKHL